MNIEQVNKISNSLLQEDTRKRKRDLEVSTQERTDLLTKINELELYISSSDKELRILISRKQVCFNCNISLLHNVALLYTVLNL